MVVNHNLIAMNGQRQYKAVTNSRDKRMEKLSSGYRINRAADDAAGLSISEKMRFQIRGLTQGVKNMQEGVNYCKVADGALHEVHSMLQRMNELSIQAANGTNSDTERMYLDQEIQHLKEEMDRIFETTKYNEEFIFKCDDQELEGPLEPYRLGLSGYPDDLYIYNETYDDTTKTATFGGIAYRGKRYEWSSIDPDMYDSTTGTFHAGSYTLKADDGSVLSLICEEGSKPPEVSREFQVSANGSGIIINNECIPWSQVQTEDGHKINEGGIENKPYYFHYHGVTASFTPDAADELIDVMNKLSDIKWQSTYKLPTEKQALFTDFSKTYTTFKNNDEVKRYLDGDPDFADNMYTLRADDTGLWLEQNNTMVANSNKTWAELGITNWGDQSKDIWSDKTYTYTYDPAPAGSDTISFTFQVVNEISKDSAIDALDGITLPGIQSSVDLDNHANLGMDATYSNVMSGKIVRDTIRLTLGEEYGLGRDYTTPSDTFGSTKLVYDKNNNSFSAVYSNTLDGTTTTKTYNNTSVETNTIISNIKNQIKTDMNDYLDVIKARYIAGATSPTETNLAALLSPNNITGNGGTTYLEDIVTLDPADIASGKLNSTLHVSKPTSFAGASIDFSGLGTSFELVDLIGMGFNSTCQTCNNHYSIQFTTPDITQANWNSTTPDPNNPDQNSYQFSSQTDGSNYTLYIDISSMDGKINDGVAFTNALVNIIDASGFDFHYTQYATNTDDAKLYVFDNRPYYISDGVSTATDASFSPYAYGFNSVAKYNINLYDTDDSSEYVSLNYEYDYKDIFAPSNLVFEYEENVAGKYVKLTDGTYVVYDANNPDHQSLTRYNIKKVELDTSSGSGTLDDYLDEYIKNHILQETADASQMDLVSDYAKYNIGNQVNENKALITEYNTPVQIYKEKESGVSPDKFGFKIQCSSNTKDSIYIEKQNLSVYRMGIKKLSVKTEKLATKAIDMLTGAFVKVNIVRSKFGTYQNRLEHSIANANNVAENTTAAESRIRDTDMAKELQNLSVENILVQAGEAILAQANSNAQNVVSLLQV